MCGTCGLTLPKRSKKTIGVRAREAGSGEGRGSECGRELWRLGLFYATKDGRWRVEGGGCGLGTPGRSQLRLFASLPVSLCLCMELHGCLTSIAGSNLRKISHRLPALGTLKSGRHLEDVGHNSKMLPKKRRKKKK